ncbi:uncharacterized protein [Leuresthes tenuis]|uniref:uncharacterized protein isoform X1 n=1 Tax=Leuresthes tenuis TaxID=355514 RepID=UPI003B513D75
MWEPLFTPSSVTVGYLHTEFATASNMVHACVFPNCPNKSIWTKFSFHRLPFRDLDLLKLWLVALKMDLKTEVGALKRMDHRVCSAHFAPEDFCPPKTQNEGQKGRRLILRKNTIPMVAEGKRDTVKECRVNANCQVSPIIRHVASQTDPPDFDFPKTRSVGTQLSMKTLQNHFRSTGTQVKVTSRDHGMCTVTLPLNSPMLFLQPTLVKRPSKRPRLNLAEDEEEGPSECSTSTMVHKAEDST